MDALDLDGGWRVDCCCMDASLSNSVTISSREEVQKSILDAAI